MRFTEHGFTRLGEATALDEVDVRTAPATDGHGEVVDEPVGALSGPSRPPRYPTLEAASARFRGSMWRERAVG